MLIILPHATSVKCRNKIFEWYFEADLILEGIPFPEGNHLRQKDLILAFFRKKNIEKNIKEQLELEWQELRWRPQNEAFLLSFLL